MAKITRRRRSNYPKLSKEGAKYGSVLIVACDAQSLETQGHRLAQDMYDRVDTMAPMAIRQMVRSTSEQSLGSEFARCLDVSPRFDLVVLVGHSNVHGLRLTADGPRTWKVVAEWIKRFRPKLLLLVACEGGRWLPCRELFGGIPTLREIYGSPIRISDSQASALTLLAPYLLLGGRLPEDIRFLQTANVVATGGLIFRRSKSEFRQTGAEEGTVWAVFGEVFRTLLAG